MPHLRALLARSEFDLPMSGVEARLEFARRVDQVRTWLDECCEVSPVHSFVARTGLYNAYKAWAARDGHKPVKATELYDRLGSIPGIGVARAPEVGTRGFTGIKIIDAVGVGYDPVL
jgi:hypothetical protein